MNVVAARILQIVIVISFGTGCEQVNPLEGAEPIGEFPKWGASFDKPTPSDDSLLASDTVPSGPAPVGAERDDQKGGAAVPSKDPTADESWGRGDVVLGKTTYLNQCALCHGPDGRGGNRAGVGVVPNLNDQAWHDRVDDKHIASTIVHGRGAMPSFMQSLTKDELNGVVAYVRSLRTNDSAPAAP